MVDLSIDTFKSKLTGGGARSNLFRATVNFPSFAQGDVELTSFMCKGASFPSSQTEAIDVPFRGRTVPFEGDRTYEPVTLTIINDVDHPVREAFIRWKDAMNHHSGNTGLQNPADYFADASIEQVDKTGNVTVKHDLIGAWPVNIGNIEVAYDTNNQIQEFTVELRYMYWKQDGVTQ